MSINKSCDKNKIQEAQTHHSLNNHICAYRNCSVDSSVRLYFPLGFSALFCHKCAKILLIDRIATPEVSDYEKGIYLDVVYDFD